MDLTQSLDEIKVIAALLHDVSTSHGVVFNNRALKLTLKKVESRTRAEGIGFLTKTLPRLGRAFDKALCGKPLNAVNLGFKPMVNSQLPRFLGELFSLVLAQNGEVLPLPCAKSVSAIRQVLFAFGKYELPYTDDQELHVVSQFEKTEDDVKLFNVKSSLFPLNNTDAPNLTHVGEFHFWNFINKGRLHVKVKTTDEVRHTARILLARLFADFDPKDIVPRHGPGAVATKQRLWDKFRWTNVSAKITDCYPLDEYFYASLGHVCDRLQTLSSVTDRDLPARVILVPKDSRGPRLISCEPVDYQWVQQGLGRAIVRHVENNELTKFNVFFTNQQPNQFGALLGSEFGRYATIDLKEASDRISVGLVRLLFPSSVFTYLMACRSSSTVLPDGKELILEKFAPMGSCLCFPIMALCIWAILTAAAPDADARESILVYGDDVIVPTAYATDAITHLESFGLLVNRDKSCIGGLFRESCGTDAFKGINVTPVRFRTVLETSRSPESYCSWIAYANQLYDKKYYSTYDCIVSGLHRIYGEIPDWSMRLACPSLRVVSEEWKPKRKRINIGLQKVEYRVLDVRAPKIDKVIDGWLMLLRYFTEKDHPMSGDPSCTVLRNIYPVIPDSVSMYTRRSTSMLVHRWR